MAWVQRFVAWLSRDALGDLVRFTGLGEYAPRGKLSLNFPPTQLANFWRDGYSLRQQRKVVRSRRKQTDWFRWLNAR